MPPPPPPIPRTTPDRLAAWAGVFGSPAVLLICLVLGISLPQLLAYLLVIGFVGGFIYLVIQMPREPRDPGDDGAVLSARRARRTRRARRARSAAPTSPASGPSSAATHRRHDAVLGAHQRPARAARAGSSSRSPAAETPPPTTTTSGSNAATRPASPTPEPVPDRGEGLPGDEVAVRGGGGDHRAGELLGLALAQLGQHRRLRADPVAREAHQRVARGVLLPAAGTGRTRTPGRPAPPACGRTPRPCPAHPRSTVPPSTSAPPMPVPIVTISADAAPRAAPSALSARAAQLASLSRATGAPQRSARRSRTGSPAQGRCGANMTRSPAASTKPAAARPIPATVRPPRHVRTAAVSASSTAVTSTRRPGVRRVAVRDHGAVDGDLAGEHLGAADVDADVEAPPGRVG